MHDLRTCHGWSKSTEAGNGKWWICVMTCLTGSRPLSPSSCQICTINSSHIYQSSQPFMTHSSSFFFLPFSLDCSILRNSEVSQLWSSSMSSVTFQMIPDVFSLMCLFSLVVGSEDVRPVLPGTVVSVYYDIGLQHNAVVSTVEGVRSYLQASRHVQ